MKSAVRVSRLAGVLGAAALIAIPLALLATSAAQPKAQSDVDNKQSKPGVEDKRPAPTPVPTDDIGDRHTKFDHNLHADTSKMPRVVVDSEKCTSCHASDERGNLTLPGTAGQQQKLDMPICNPRRGRLTRPGQVGHQPCLDSGCHVRDFLSTGDKAKRESPDRYQKAAAFCAGCHAGKNPPTSDSQPTVGNIYCDNDSPDHHIELNHLRHAEKAKCRDCHVVGDDYRLLLRRPNHEECANCHNGKNISPMSYCRTCHLAPGPGEYFLPRDYDDVVRACGSPEHLRRARRRGKDPSQISCFKHETREHRFRGDEPLQCSQCHYMVANRKFWSSKQRYESLRDIRSARLIDNRRDRAHSKACGGDKGCHARDVDDSSGGSEKCTLCHSM